MINVIDIALRGAEMRDIPEITAIYNQAVLNSTATFDIEPRTVSEREEWLRGHGDRYPVLVAEGARVLGWASLGRWAQKRAYDRSVEISLYVHGETRGLGIGSTLARGILRAGEAAGLHTVMARIVDGNDVSRRLCESLGFRYVGVMKEAGWKFGRWLDVHFYQYMLKDLSPESGEEA